MRISLAAMLGIRSVMHLRDDGMVLAVVRKKATNLTTNDIHKFQYSQKSLTNEHAQIFSITHLSTSVDEK